MQTLSHLILSDCSPERSRAMHESTGPKSRVVPFPENRQWDRIAQTVSEVGAKSLWKLLEVWFPSGHEEDQVIELGMFQRDGLVQGLPWQRKRAESF
jgi:hypothetical protein